jgi:hypothetical protein
VPGMREVEPGRFAACHHPILEPVLDPIIDQEGA